jgi:cobalt-zinc-cadmium efflux system protein
MSKACGHGHHHHDHHHKTASGHPSNTVRNIAMAFALNASFAVIELVGGWWTQSVAIQADAIHDFGDSLALAAALGLQIFSATKASDRFNFGFKRLSLLSAWSTSFLLFGSSIYIVTRALERLQNPVQPHLDGMLMLAVLGVIVNGAAAWKMGHGKTENERALSWHMVEDLLGWVAVLIGSIAMRYVDAPWLDPALSLVIAGIVLMGASRNFWASSKLFLQAAPNLDFAMIQSQIEKTHGIISVLSLKVWSLDGAHHIASLHAKITPDLNRDDRSRLKSKIQEVIGHFGEFDTTIEWDETD